MSGELSAQKASNAENVSIWWRHHELEFIPNSQNHGCHLFVSSDMQELDLS